MSEPPSSPYKSKFFNFLNRQTIRVKEQVERTIRQVKVAATWGVQAVMYPIYLIFQSTRYASYRFQQTTRETWKRLQPTTEPARPLEVDAPIQQVLESIKRLELNPASIEAISAVSSQIILDRPSSSAITATEPTSSQIVEPGLQEPSIETIGGKLGHLGAISVASQLETRQLVLVTPNHQILDILTPEQQKLLMSRIIWEIATYKHNWRLRSLSSRGFRAKIVPSRQTQVLPPIRWFWQAMAWLQSSEVAIAIDLFQESSLIPAIDTQTQSLVNIPPQISQIIKELEIPGMVVVERQLSSLDIAIARAETYLLSGSNLANLAGYTAPSESQITDVSDRQSSLTTPENRLSSRKSDPYRWQKLLWAAIDYFFGRNHGNNLTSSVANSAIALPQNPSLSLSPNYKPDDSNPWLDWNDLFPESPASNSPLPLPKTSRLPQPKSAPRPKLAGKKARNPQLAPREELPSRSVWGTVKSFLGSENRERLPKNLAQVGSNSLEPEDSTKQLSRKSQKLGEAIASSSSPSLEYTPNWIETEATSKGYVKRPLQKFVDWLDRLMLSIENLFERIYLQIKKWFR